MFLKLFWIKVTNIQVISEITQNNFSVTPVGVYSRPRAQLLLSHICISVLAILSNIDCYVITLLIVLLIWTTLFYTSISFSVISAVHKCFQSSFCPLLLHCKYCILSLTNWATICPYLQHITSHSVAMSLLNKKLDIYLKIWDHILERAKSQLQHIKISEKSPEQ